MDAETMCYTLTTRMKRLSLGHEIFISRFTCEQNSKIKKKYGCAVSHPAEVAAVNYNTANGANTPQQRERQNQKQTR